MSNQTEWVDLSSFDSDQRKLSRNILIPIYNQVVVIRNLIIFAPNLFNFEIIFAFIIFGDFFAYRVFTFIGYFAISRQAPDGRVEDVTVVQTGPINLWV